jgi:hypothetical protein
LCLRAASSRFRICHIASYARFLPFLLNFETSSPNRRVYIDHARKRQPVRGRVCSGKHKAGTLRLAF